MTSAQLPGHARTSRAPGAALSAFPINATDIGPVRCITRACGRTTCPASANRPGRLNRRNSGLTSLALFAGHRFTAGLTAGRAMRAAGPYASTAQASTYPIPTDLAAAGLAAVTAIITSNACLGGSDSDWIQQNAG